MAAPLTAIESGKTAVEDIKMRIGNVLDPVHILPVVLFTFMYEGWRALRSAEVGPSPTGIFAFQAGGDDAIKSSIAESSSSTPAYSAEVSRAKESRTILQYPLVVPY